MVFWTAKTTKVLSHKNLSIYGISYGDVWYVIDGSLRGLGLLYGLCLCGSVYMREQCGSVVVVGGVHVDGVSNAMEGTDTFKTSPDI